MAVNGVGLFTRLYSWVTDAANGLKIQAARMDAEFNNYRDAFNLTFWRDGRTPMDGNLQMGDNSVTGLEVGSIGAPSVSFTGAATTGIYLPVAGVLGFTLNGVERARFVTTGMSLISATGSSRITLDKAATADDGGFILASLGVNRWAAGEMGSSVGNTGNFYITRFGRSAPADFTIDYATGAAVFGATVRAGVNTYANRPTVPSEGDTFNFTDSNTAVWGAVIAGGGANKVAARYNGTNWTVTGI